MAASIRAFALEVHCQVCELVVWRRQSVQGFILVEGLSLVVQPLEVQWGHRVRCVVVEGSFDSHDCPGRRVADRGAGDGHHHQTMTLHKVCVCGGGGGGCDAPAHCIYSGVPCGLFCGMGC